MTESKAVITLLPSGEQFTAERGANLLELLRRKNLLPQAVCGGTGSCGKCVVSVDGELQRACSYNIDNSIELRLPENKTKSMSLSSKLSPRVPPEERQKGASLCVDLGTSTVACALLDAGGEPAGCLGFENPQCSFGGDVVTRLRSARDPENLRTLSAIVRQALQKNALELCRDCGVAPESVKRLVLAGNPAMQQLFMGDSVSNLLEIPFSPIYTEPVVLPASGLLPAFSGAVLLPVPDISAYVGGDTLACVAAAEMNSAEKPVLLIDIGTNGELVLGDRHGMCACACAAGPALEGAGISCGMRAEEGALASLEISPSGEVLPTVIGNIPPTGICGSGLIDAVAALMELRLLDRRGKILSGDSKAVELVPGLSLTAEDIRAFQLAKGAVAAGIELLFAETGIKPEELSTVLLAGSFGSKLKTSSACRTGLIPAYLERLVEPVGNAALSGAVFLAQSSCAYAGCAELLKKIRPVDLGSHPAFPGLFARCMYL